MVAPWYLCVYVCMHVYMYIYIYVYIYVRALRGLAVDIFGVCVYTRKQPHGIKEL